MSHLPTLGPVVAVAASGGRDSAALLHATCRAALPLGVQVLALHIDHGLHPDSAQWAAAVSRQARRWGADVAVRRLDSAPPRGSSVEAWARRARYAAMSEMARDAGCTTVLLAHHRGDQAETFLLQAVRGQGLAGLAAMPTEALRDGITWIRPWLQRPRSAVEAYVRRYRLAYIDDPSNDDPRWTRNALRHQALPALASAWPAVEVGLAAAAAHCADADALLREWWTEQRSTWVDSAGALKLALWPNSSCAKRQWVLQRWLREQLGHVPQALIERVGRECEAAGSARWPTAGGELRAYRGRLTWVPDANAPQPFESAWREGSTVSFDGPGTYPAPGGHWQLEAVSQGGAPPEALQGLVWRWRAGGERFAHAPRATPRSLKLAFQRAGVPAWLRKGPLLFSRGGELVHVPGLGLDGRVHAAPGAVQWAVHWVADRTDQPMGKPDQD